VMMIVLWLRHNIPNALDIAWLKQGGGLLGRGNHPAAGKFNAGQKIVFWSVILTSLVIVPTGYLLMFPFEVVPDVAGMQVVQVLHSVVAILLTTVILAHIYIGTVGMEGAFSAMNSGQVDLNWAREHHSLWAAEMMGERGQSGRPPAAGHGDAKARPAGAD
jgi:formate dehydrogenase subunit gamma